MIEVDQLPGTSFTNAADASVGDVIVDRITLVIVAFKQTQKVKVI